MGLSEPALSLTDLALGIVVIALAVLLQRTPGVHRYWRLTFWWVGAAALAGAVHHGVVTYSDTWAGPSWAIISTMVVVAVSYLLAASVVEVLGPGRGRVFWVLRSVGLIAYVGLAIAGYAGVNSILACEGITMIAILALWGRALRDHNPLAVPVIVAILASGAAAGVAGPPVGRHRAGRAGPDLALPPRPDPGNDPALPRLGGRPAAPAAGHAGARPVAELPERRGQSTLRTGRPYAFLLGGCPSPPPPPRAT